MLILILYSGVIAAIIGLFNLFSINLWSFFTSILSIVIIVSERSWVHVYKSKAAAILEHKKLIDFTDREEIALKYASGIILPRVEYGFRIIEISACSGLIQMLIPINIILALIQSNYFIILILIPLLFLSVFLYAPKLPAANIVDDLKRINHFITYSHEKYLSEIFFYGEFSEYEYNSLIEKIRDVISKVKQVD